jgi:hypothetical protein
MPYFKRHGFRVLNRLQAQRLYGLWARIRSVGSLGLLILTDSL